MSDKSHPVWNIAKLAVLGVIFIGFAALGTSNGWDWKTDLAPLVAMLSASGVIDAVKPKS